MVVSSPEPLPEAALLAETAWLRRLARHMVGEEDADDLVQDACVAALERPPKDPSRLRGWLAQVVRNAVRGRYRDRLRRLRREAVAAREEAEPEGDDVVVRAETQQRVVAAVLSLGEPYRTTILLRFFDDFPPRKVAERMGVPVATVHTRLRRGFDLLRRRLDERGRSWAVVLLPLLAREGKLGALLAAGGAVMSKKAALVGAAAVLALSLGSLVWLSRAPGEEARRGLAANPRAAEDREAPEPGGGTAAVEGRVRLRGRVVDDDGNGIPGARIDLVSARSGRTGFGTTVSRFGPGILDATRAGDQVRREWERMHTSPVSRAGTACDEEGRFDLAADPLPGDDLLVRAPGFGALTHTGLSLLRSAAGIEIRLKKQAACRVRVVDGGGSPVAGAQVWLLAGSELLARAETDVDGRVNFEAEPRGVAVLVEHRDHPPAFRLMRDDPREEVKVELRTTRVIEGTVLRAPDRAPVAGATVCIDGGAPHITTTNATGGFILRCGDLQQWFPRPALLVDAGPAGVAAIPVTDLPPNPLEILLRPTLTLEGRLEGDVPLEGLKVFALQPGLPWRGGRADAAGLFRIEGAAADVPVRVLFDPWDPAYEESGALPAETTYEPWPGFATFEIVGKGAIEGRVIDERGDPVAGAKIAMRPPYRFVDGIGTTPMCAGEEYTDDEGRFRIDGVTARSLPARPDVIYAPTVLRASAKGFVWRDEGPFALEPGEQRAGVVVRLERGLSITGRVVMEDGSPVPRVRVRVSERDIPSDDNRHSGWAYVDAEGRYRMDALPAGAYAVTVGAEEFQPVWHDRVPAGSEAPPLVLRRGATIAGVVVDEAGHPIRDVHVNACRAGLNRTARDFSDADGRFRICQLEPGSYDVTAGPPGYLWEKKAGVAAPSGGVRLVLRRGLAIRGRIVRADGTALRLVNVNAERVRCDPNLPGHGGQASTDDDGRFEIGGLSEGEFRLTFEKRAIAGDDDSTLPPLAGVASGSEILVRAETGKFIAGKVVDREGKPVRGVPIEAIPLDPDGYAGGTVMSAGDGGYRLGPLRGRRFTLVAGWGSEFGFAADVEAGAADASIAMGKGEVLAGRVVNRDGNPTAANLAVIHGELMHTWESSTEDGRFRIVGLPPGTYFVRAAARNASYVYERWRDANRRGPSGTKVESGTLDAVLTVR